MATTRWIAEDPAHRNGALRELDKRLTEEGKVYVLVFDSLDVIARDWGAIRVQMEGLLQLALAVKALRRVRLKLFIRPDMADDRRMWMVGDASKLRHDEVQLRWTRRDLYGMLWTHIANPAVSQEDDAAEAFRGLTERVLGQAYQREEELWRIPHSLRDGEAGQRDLFHVLAGPYMGAGNKTGDTYLWVPNHLADAAGNAAPRSFILAMRRASETSVSESKVLDRSGIEDGVREASKIRLAELGEDYKWMHDVLGSLAGLTVPIGRDDLARRWQERGILQKLQAAASQNSSDLRFIPPSEVLEASTEWEAYDKLIESLRTLRIVLEIPDERINMPDLFRIEANVKRRGGMKPRQ
ncbi:MAG: hypothetical protein HQL39_13840 [Alphaproteobacteria bacterium]|nr:hypothetical protein [Alphaproteobacteria bacterium]